MAELPRAMFRKWIHSFEEDTGGITVYRSTTYQFPRARGRAGIEFRADGEFIDWRISAADTQRGIIGRWQMEDRGRVRISFEGEDQNTRIIEIVQCNEDVLTVRHCQLNDNTPSGCRG
jgi:hypothetical protein